MLWTETVASYNLSYENEQIVADKPDFDINAYSRMKHGDREATLDFAAGLTSALVSQIPELLHSDLPPDFLVAYKAVPPACYYLSKYCLNQINAQRTNEGLEPGRIIQVFKNRVTATDYAASSVDARNEELDSIGFSLNGQSIDEHPAVIVDDVRITGAAEERIVRALEDADPVHLALGYVAIFDPNQAANNPSVESDLNSASVTSISDLLPLIEQDNFDLNIRTLKLILNQNSDELRQDFLEAIPRALRESLYKGAMSTGPEFVISYMSAVRQVARSLDIRVWSK